MVVADGSIWEISGERISAIGPIGESLLPPLVFALVLIANAIFDFIPDILDQIVRTIFGLDCVDNR